MGELKTKANSDSVDDFLNAIEDPKKKADIDYVLTMMREVTGNEPKMWGGSIVGFDSYHYKYDSGREGNWFITGFSPRKQALTLYIMAGFGRYDELLSQLGKYKTGKSCLYIKNLEDVDKKVLKDLVQSSVQYMRDKHH